MLNYLTNDQNERVLLVSLRYFFSSLGDISTFVLSYLLLQGERSSTNTKTMLENNWLSDLANQTVEHNMSQLSTDTASKTAWLNLTEGTRASASVGDTITIDDMPLFRNIALLLTAYGLLFVIAFQCGVPERQGQMEPEDKDPDPSAEEMIRSVPGFIKSLDELHSIASQMHEVGRSRHNSCTGSASRIKNVPKSSDTKLLTEDSTEFVWYNWFGLARFWVDCFIFTTIRLSVTLSSLYISPFLLRTLQLDKSSIMLVPLAIYCTSLVTTLLQHRVVKLLGRLSGFARQGDAR
ncbi:hypothetical protein FGIG_10014 [Fasciola gigantica]|uniref:Uncharacterized protein n=1 Tax=Fasciola gigantica TaxID=46835 RepID=A0A504YDF8_FASGI|nr:hypothetical protein FGIG_10014 [Fasciola gigantica]